ncbi:hypothetical protein VCUG_00479 [Vavraia culicis subsp. floridensis]|uniref:Uncharacterized protein n=1 Tax=Vavraia culicis (isolate floridensis) TaxID=948595 RepID=L2GWK6_VAVCU|nr:uncharacterized protein VCUG_00479 [Vavraia culicis subsp. floridensis]ELA48056.1 hypothetical protein VCUG_00479 [Vavraia culicis subsp. floridensis]
MKYFKFGNNLLHLNVVAVVLLVISSTVIIFLESHSKMPIELNVFMRKNRNYYLKKNAKEIKNELYSKGKIRIKLAETEKKYNLDFYKDRDVNGTIYLIKSGNDIVMVCTAVDYMQSIDSGRLLDYYMKSSGYLNVRIERASLCRRMNDLMNDILQDRHEGDIPTSGMVIHDEKLGLALFFCVNSWTVKVSSQESLHQSLLFNETAG